MPRNDEDDKNHLTRVARNILDQLARDTKRLHLREGITLKPSTTRGWRVELGSLGRGEPRLEVWLCEYAQEGTRHFWYGLYAAQADKLRQLTVSLPESLRPVKEFSGLDMRLARDASNEYVLRSPLSSADYDQPIYEQYQESGDRYSYFGKYDSSGRRDDAALRDIAGRASAFLEDFLASRIKA